jgi:hypothetical protein
LPDRNVLFYGDPERRPGESAGHKTAHSQGANPIEYTDKKENKFFLIYKEIQMGSGAKSYMRKPGGAS